MKRILVNDTLLVVETVDGDAYIGTVKRTGDFITVYSGLRGHPPVIHMADIDTITPALEHPDVVKS